jgi:hypothetical protein
MMEELVEVVKGGLTAENEKNEEPDVLLDVNCGLFAQARVKPDSACRMKNFWGVVLLGAGMMDHVDVCCVAEPASLMLLV